jgi:hypothetical protein
MLLLNAAVAAPAPADDDASVVDFIVVEAPASLRPILERELDILRWRGSRFVTPALLDELLVDARKQAWEVAVEAGVRITGTAQEPRVQLVSDPPYRTST